MAEFEFPGVFVEETGGQPKPTDGVPTDSRGALTPADRRRWISGIVIAGFILAGLGIGLAAIRPTLLGGLVGAPWGIAMIAALVVSALVLNLWRALVEWRRRSAGRPALRYGRVAIAVFVFQLATLVGFGLCVLIGAASLLIATNLSGLFLIALLNVVIGCFLIRLAAGSVRDAMLLVQAARRCP